MMKRIGMIPVAALLLLVGCSHRLPTATVDVIDTSLSITPQAEHAALAAVRQQIGHLQRGDVLMVIPITGDAANDAGGRILRLQVPSVREPYDAGLRRFHVDARKQFAAWAASVRAEPSRTDILGALDAARQEMASVPKEDKLRLIVVSDFLEDDGSHRFVSDRALTNEKHARALAARLRAQHEFTLRGVTVCLGRLESSEFGLLPPARQEAVNAFWPEYFAYRNHAPEIQFDGVGLLGKPDGYCVATRQ